LQVELVTKGIKVITVPAAARSFRKSRLETLPPELGGVCCVINKPNNYISINFWTIDAFIETLK